MMPTRRMLLVHAHPDDESITTGATMARYAAEEAGVTLLTCTLGEEGEIIPPALSQLAADAADQLGGYRIGELAAAMAALGVRDHRYLGGAGRFRDSGMAGTPANKHPRAFWRADSDPAVFQAAVEAAVDVIRELRPQVVVTYDANGGYGHPDHIMAHRVTQAAVEAAGVESYGRGQPWQVAKVYWTALPQSVLRRGIEALRAAGDEAPFGVVDDADTLPYATPDQDVTTAVDARAWAAAKTEAMRAHASQISVDGPFFALSNQLGQEVLGVEYYQLVQGELGPDRGPDGRESDLFSGLDLA